MVGLFNNIFIVFVIRTYQNYHNFIFQALLLLSIKYPKNQGAPGPDDAQSMRKCLLSNCCSQTF